MQDDRTEVGSSSSRQPLVSGCRRISQFPRSTAAATAVITRVPVVVVVVVVYHNIATVITTARGPENNHNDYNNNELGFAGCYHHHHRGGGGGAPLLRRWRRAPYFSRGTRPSRTYRARVPVLHCNTAVRARQLVVSSR